MICHVYYCPARYFIPERMGRKSDASHPGPQTRGTEGTRLWFGNVIGTGGTRLSSRPSRAWTGHPRRCATSVRRGQGGPLPRHARRLSPIPPAHRKERDERATASPDSARLLTAFDRATGPPVRALHALRDDCIPEMDGGEKVRLPTPVPKGGLEIGTRAAC